ncbi:zinc ribbon domain-containing protein [Pseudonocardia endophytica]|uniref:Putative FmdB family regulatory protein n=1 Tax=Pseudonocardia endophytica TaxID=401976 RepID=A0A4R1HGJ7_PSEEN|nr:zinc ribbon domain-containing protein [Pseudonocardia endophytica]TCK21304.1 putative FmdB family regulatory protein [Pseudonocardia endophytica]
MPTYDFRCDACGATREVRARYETVAGLELVCVLCGGRMTKTFTATVGLMTRSAAAPSPAPPRRKGRRGGDSCDAALKLTKPNPFAAELRRVADANQGAEER